MRPAGFTLVEVIVVVSILAFLTALLSPMLSSSREQARTVLCASRIKDMLTCLKTYEVANGTFPSGYDGLHSLSLPGGDVGDARIDTPGWYWFNEARILQRNSTRERRLLQCPSKRLQNCVAKTDVLRANYGVNASVCKMNWPSSAYDVDEFQGTPLSDVTVPRPGETLLLADSGYTLVSWWHATEKPPVKLGDFGLDTAYMPGLEINQEKTLVAGTASDAVGGRHRGKIVNVGFVDGHVSPTKASDLLVDKTGEDEWNNRPLWRPK